MLKKCLKLLLLLFPLLYTHCYSSQWVKEGQNITNTKAPQSIASIFKKYPRNVMTLEMESPGIGYRYDASEKDKAFGKHDKWMRFEKAELRLHSLMPKGTVLVDIDFVDKMGNRVTVKKVDLLQLTPKFDTKGEMLYSELLLEEYNRFGIYFRREQAEFDINLANKSSIFTQVDDRTHRLNITNNCLEPSKWEMLLLTKSILDETNKYHNTGNLNAEKMVAHSWLYVDEILYKALLTYKNPNLDINNYFLPYDSLEAKAENAVIRLEELRYPIQQKTVAKTLEIGHQSRRKLTPLEEEQNLKWQYGLWLDRLAYPTYQEVTTKPVKIARFQAQGYYDAATPNTYDFGFLKEINKVNIQEIKTPDTNCYVEFILTGKNAPYKVVIGNIDLAYLEEQKLSGYLFGYNTFPKARRYNPSTNTIFYTAENYPDARLQPYILLLDNQTNKWVNNQKKGVEKVYLSYDDMDKGIIEIYLLSYERVVPIWMARIALPQKITERVIARKLWYEEGMFY